MFYGLKYGYTIICLIFRYDGHFIVRELGKFEGQINIIPSTTEKYISFSKVQKEEVDFEAGRDDEMCDMVIEDMQADGLLPPEEDSSSDEKELDGELFANEDDVEERQPPPRKFSKMSASKSTSIFM